MESFDENKVLAEDIRLKLLDSHLNRVSLYYTHYSKIDGNKRGIHLLYHPIVITSVFVIQLIKCFINVLISDPILLLWTGDWTRVYNIRVHANIGIILLCLLSLSWVALLYFNYKIGVEPTFLRLFQMMSGSVPPKVVGLKDITIIESLINKTRIILKAVEFNNRWLIIPFGILLSLGTYLTKATLLQTLLFGILNSIFYAMVLYHGFNIMLYQGFYFYIICIYLRFRIRKLNENLVKTKSWSSLSLSSVLREIDSLYKQINEYNDSFWSKYFATFWLFFGSLILFLLYISLFSKIYIIFNLMFCYGFILLMTFFLFVILNASSVNSEANKSHKILNSIYVSLYCKKNIVIKNKRLPLRQLLIKLKASS